MLKGNVRHGIKGVEFEPMVEQVERNPGVLPDQGSADASYSSYD